MESILTINQEFPKAIVWWEKKRIAFNIILLCAISLSGFLLGLFNHPEFLMVSIIWIFGANVFYTMSWASELLLKYYFRKDGFNEISRKSLFVLGSIFSIFWTLLNYLLLDSSNFSIDAL